MELAVKSSDISKSYGSVTALKAVNLEVKQGELFGLIGPDGAGKTSLIRILATLLLPDAGTAHVLGFDVVDEYKILRKKMGYMPGKFSLYQDLTVEENLNLFAAVFNTTLEKNYELIEDIYKQIEPFKNRKAGQLSGGMKQKLALSCAMIHEPKILYLDEPTTGVDAVSRNEFWDMLKKLREKGITIIVSTPYMDEANLCDRVALIQNGRIMSVDTPQAIIDDFQYDLFAIKANDKYQLLQQLQKKEQTRSVHAFGGVFHYTDQREQVTTEQLEEELAGMLGDKVQVQRISPEIEDCFIELMTHSAHE